MFYISVLNRGRIKSLYVLGLVIPVLAVRDLLYLFFPHDYIMVLSDIAVITIYLLWLRTYTHKHRLDLFYLLINGIIIAAGAAAVIGGVTSAFIAGNKAAEVFGTTQEDLTVTQFDEWQAYNKIQPIQSWREDYRFAMLCSVVTNLALSTHAKKGRKPKLTEPLDFMPEWGGKKEVEKQTPEQMKAILLNAFKGVKKIKGGGLKKW